MIRRSCAFVFLFLFALSAYAQSNIGKSEMTIWFDKPTSLDGKSVWYKGRTKEWIAKNKPVSAGDRARNDDQEWESKSLPIGNGSIGANIMGSVFEERITFNEKTLWRGGPNTSKGADYYWNVNKNSAHLLKDIRKAFEEGDNEKAARLTRDNFNSVVPYESTRETPFRFGSFTTMGELLIETSHNEKKITDYSRALHIDSALAVVAYNLDGVKFERKYFTSYPHNVMVAKFTANKQGRQNLTFRYTPNPVSQGTMTAVGKNELCYTAKLDNNSMKYVVRIHAEAVGGTVSNANNCITVKDADEVVFYVTADTDYKMNFNPDFKNPRTYVGVNPEKTTKNWLCNAVRKGYDNLWVAHYSDFASLFNRVKLQINNSQYANNIPTAERLSNYRKGATDHSLETLYYQFGRYLLIASSRKGNMPANLQGMWHNNVDGPWRVDYHNNINLQMNYWPALSTNLAECTLPLVDFIETLVKPGEKTAKAYFGASGWTASISGNIFGFTAPLESKDMSWNFNPMAGPWLATHVWDYYAYTKDLSFLKKRGYSIIKSSANFATDYLWHRADGSYTAAPSTSPEHGPVDKGATFVHAVVREALLNAIEASKILGVDKADRAKWENVLKNLAPYKIGRYGQLMEWSEDIDDPNSKHRHVNHLFCLHPGRTLSPITTPELATAAKVVLNHRGDGATGWSMGWKLNQWARLHDGDRAYKLFQNLIKNGTLDNLWDTHPPFQIDGNFGGTAGITEMLLQSHMDLVHILPALPTAWTEGEVKGLRAKGNLEVNMKWKDGKLTLLTLRGKAGDKFTLRYQDRTKEVTIGKSGVLETSF